MSISDTLSIRQPWYFPLSLCQHNICRKGRQFLDEEAELSEDEREEVSTDEEDGEEMNHSLEGFVVNNTHSSQGLDGRAPWLFQKMLFYSIVSGFDF